MKKKILCLIPARSGSKRIKNKNIININNKPLIKFVCEKISKSKFISYFFVASDKKNIFKTLKLDKKFRFFHRSKKSSTRTAKTEEVVLEFLKKENLNSEIIILLQLTNPFIDYKILDKAINYYLQNKFDSMLSVVESKHFIWKNTKYTIPINYNYRKREMSQDIKSYMVENGSFYIFKKKNFLKYKNRLHGNIGFFKMPKESYFEIDDNDDLKIVRKLLKNKNL